MSPKTAERHFSQALTHHQRGELAEARAEYLRCLESSPDHPHALMNLGSVCRQLGDTAQAVAHLRRAAALLPQDYNAHYNLGNALLDAGDFSSAVASYHAALSLAPEDAGTWYNLGLTLGAMHDTDGERDAYRKAIAADAEHRNARLNLAGSYAALGEVSPALHELQALIARAPDFAPALNNLATLQQDMGQHDAAMATLQRTMEFAPELPQPRSNVLMNLQYHPGLGDADLYRHALEWGKWATDRAAALNQGVIPTRPGLEPLAGRPLRVGYVSADLCAHPVGLFLDQVLAAHDATAVLPVIYSNGSTVDDVSRRLQQVVRQKTDDWAWRDVRKLDDAALATQIRADAIDILVDLSGHTGKTRLAMFALRPAPVQISWLGYFATTGLPAIDFVILDPYHAPPGTEAQFCECIIRLPHNRFCYQPVHFAPEVSPPPLKANGFVTFGSFNNTAKLNEQVLLAWAAMLKAVAHSRLILKWRSFADRAFSQKIADFFAAQGIVGERLELRPASIHRSLLEEYADIDIALDPFPFSGGHTSCEALWMGVPVVTLPQGRVVSRQTWSFLNNIGLPGLAAADVSGYVQLAVTLANSPDTLQELRQTLRDKLRASPLCAVAGYTRSLEEAYRAAWQAIREQSQLPPEQPTAAKAEQLHQLALQAWQQGDAATARQDLEAAIMLNPDVAAYHANLGVMLKQLGAGEDRIVCYQRAIDLAPAEALYYGNLAGALNEAKRYAEGEAAARRAIVLTPNCADYWFNLGGSLAGQERWLKAAEAFDVATAHRGDWVEAIKASGEALGMAGNWHEAAIRFHLALQRLPKDAPAADKLAVLRVNGQAQQHLYRFPNAEKCFREAVALDPDDVALLTDLGNVLKAQAKFDEAQVFYQRVVELRPELAGGYCNLGTVAQSAGNYAEAIAHYRRALSLAPQMRESWSNLGACLAYSPAHGPADVLAAFREFDLKMALALRDPRPHANDRSPWRRLKVGYVSPDFRKHAVAYFALPLIEGHDEEQVEVFCYFNHRQNDEWTKHFQAIAEHWIPCADMNDDALAERIRADNIDILVDLSGHTDNNRLLVFARKPAPVQVTWMGYVTTTGMSAMDWRVTHLDADPPGVEAHYCEELWRLPGTMWCYRPLLDMPEVSPPPIERKGYVTFGSFNRYSKNSPLVLETWAKIMNEVPDSRLLICVPEGSIREQMARFFAERGINPERISGFAKVSHEDFWKLHAEVDIALDPFPFGGGTTTCETLWLGVPLVTCTGKEGGDFAPRFASRMGQAFLRNIGLPELVAETLPQYVDITVQLAQDAPRMAQLRQRLRPLMAAAPLTDEARFVREMEVAYRGMWQAWCAEQNEASGASA